jgi:hypothetical protein
VAWFLRAQIRKLQVSSYALQAVVYERLLVKIGVLARRKSGAHKESFAALMGDTGWDVEAIEAGCLVSADGNIESFAGEDHRCSAPCWDSGVLCSAFLLHLVKLCVECRFPVSEDCDVGYVHKSPQVTESF